MKTTTLSAPDQDLDAIALDAMTVAEIEAIAGPVWPYGKPRSLLLGKDEKIDPTRMIRPTTECAPTTACSYVCTTNCTHYTAGICCC